MTAVIQKNTSKTKAAPPPAAQAPALSAAQKAAQTRKANAAAKAKAPAKGSTSAPAPVAQETTATEGGRVGRKQLAENIYGKLKAAGKAAPLGVCEIAVVAYEEAVAEALANGSEVQLPGFGKFLVVAKEAREGRNPKTGEPVQIAAFNQVRFKVGAKLKASVNGGAEGGSEDEPE